MNSIEREKTLDALIAMMRLVRGRELASGGEIIAAAKPEHVVSMASAHKLMPSIATALKLPDVQEFADPELVDFFRFLRKENAVRNKVILDQLSSLAVGFKNRGLEPPVTLKGVSFLLDGSNISLDRFMTDIDLLVAPNTLEVVIDAMKEMGYTVQEDIEFNPQTELHYPAFVHPDYDSSVEIHFRLSQSNKTDWLKWDDLIPFCKLVQLSEGAIYLPNDEWRLSHLAYHSQVNGHYYSRRIIELRDCLDFFDLVTRQGFDLVAVRTKFSEIHRLMEFDGLASFTGSLFDDLQPVESISDGGKRWARQSRSVLIHNHNRIIWLLVDWAYIITKRIFNINAWKAAFQLLRSKEHLQVRISHWWSQFRNGLGPHG